MPHIDLTVSMDYYRTQFARAEHDPHEEMFFRSKLLGQPIRNKNVFFMMDQWEKCQGEYPDLTGCKAVIGLDNGGANDLMGIAVLIEKTVTVHRDHIGIN